MKSFYIKELDHNFVLLNKSGSLLLLNTFHDFCYHKGYTITKDIKHNTKTFIFVRNPIERMKTSFTWFLGHENICKDFFGEYNPTEMCNLEYFIKFIDRQSEIYKINNTHFLPQKYELLGKSGNTLFKINDIMVNMLYPNYEFIQIESFNETKNIAISSNKMRLGNEFIGDDVVTQTDNLFLKQLNYEDFKLFFALYHFNKTSLDLHHHGNKMLDITNQIENGIFLLLEDEYRLYGYEIKKYFNNLKSISSLI